MLKVRNLFIPNKENKYKAILLRKGALVTYTFILLFVNTFGGLLGIPEAMASSITPENIIALTNRERGSLGLNALSPNAKLAAAAQAKANNMFELQYWDHFGPNGETPWMFISQAGYAYVYAGENLAKGFRTAEGVHEAWMASPTHKANIVSVNYKDIGVAVVEGNLLGKDTVLVVQMFGNLTSQTVTPSTPSTPVVSTPPPAVRSVKESGEIKSISITDPKNGELIKDANVNIKGETTNIAGEYTVEILSSERVIGETTSKTKTWEYEKESDWEEGEHSVQAQIKGQNVKSDTLTFTIDSTPPEIDNQSITVKRNTLEYILQFSYSSDVKELQLVSGDTTFDLELTEENIATLNIPKDQLGERTMLMASDEVGNILEVDISEYFIDGNEEESSDPNLILWLRNMIGTTDGISILIVSLVFLLLVIQVYVYWKKGKLGKNIGELFTIGAWWLIILVGIFKGFGGIVN